MASLFSHSIGLPPIVAHGSEALKRRVVPDVLAGRKIAALAITEPGGGSDVARLACSARRDGDALGHRRREDLHHLGRARRLADRRGAHRRPTGAGGISLMLSPAMRRPRAHAAGQDGLVVQRHRAAAFDDCRVPAENLIGEENAGFRAIMDNFNGERLLMAAMACALRRRSASTRRWPGRASARPSASRWSSTR